MVTRKTLALLLLSLTPATAQNIQATAPPIVSNYVTTVDYSQTIFTGTPQIFGVHNIDWADSGAAASLVGTYGVTAVRVFLGLSDIVSASTTVSAYESAMGAGCPSGSVCDPSTWNWAAKKTNNYINAARAQGAKLVLCVLNPPAWLTYNGNTWGVPSDFSVFDDMVVKGYQHFMPDYVEILNEPDYELSENLADSPYSDTLTAYFAIYAHAAAALRAASPTLPIGGPALTGCCSTASAWIPKFLTPGTSGIAAGLINFVSYHNYSTANNELYNGENVPQLVKQSPQPTIPVWMTEWNANGDCSADTLNDGDGNPGTLPFVGMRLINALNIGLSQAYLWEAYPDVTNCTLYSSVLGAVNKKARVFELMSVVLGMGSGNFAVKSSSNSGATASLGALNQAGQHVAVVVNNSDSPLTQVVTLNNTGFTTSKTWNTYIASMTNATPSMPAESVSVTPVAGSVTHTISIPANAVAGVLVQ